jgi:hypothetical protein
MRPLVVLLALLAPLAASAQDSIAGTWSVTVTETGTGTCMNKPGTVSAYVWIVSTQPDGGVIVNVQGATPFPVMGGKLEGDTLTLQAYAKKQGRTDSTWIRLKVSNTEMIGLRRHMSVQPQKFSKNTVTAPCFLDLDVSAKKTG